MNEIRDHIIYFLAQKMFYLERVGRTEAYNRLVRHFEQIDLEGLLRYLTGYYGVDIERELDDFYLSEGELVFISRRGCYRFKHVYRDGCLRLVGVEIADGTGGAAGGEEEEPDEDRSDNRSEEGGAP